jgi:NAD(P)-dependent dehydrogenase (short-subunit alcohol dehydrogenase family)
MTTATTVHSIAREPRLVGQTVVVVGGSEGIGLDARRDVRRRRRPAVRLVSASK